MLERRLDKPGFVIARWGLHGAAYLRKPVYADRSAAVAARLNIDCELVVPWKGTDDETLAAINQHEWDSTRRQ